MPVDIHPGVKAHGAYKAFRQHPRIPLSIPITLRHLCGGGVRSTHGISLDLGEGGVGALLEGRCMSEKHSPSISSCVTSRHYCGHRAAHL